MNLADFWTRLTSGFTIGNVFAMIVFGSIMVAVFNIPKLKQLWEQYKQRKSDTVDPYSRLPRLDETLDNEEPTEAEYRAMLFAWVDEIRVYAHKSGNETAVATANKLLTDLFATEVKDIPDLGK